MEFVRIVWVCGFAKASVALESAKANQSLVCGFAKASSVEDRVSNEG